MRFTIKREEFVKGLSIASKAKSRLQNELSGNGMLCRYCKKSER